MVAEDFSEGGTLSGWEGVGKLACTCCQLTMWLVQQDEERLSSEDDGKGVGERIEGGGS